MIKNLPANLFNPKKTDKFFLDTNIWISLYIPNYSSNKYLVNESVTFYNKIKSSGAKIFTSSLILSEFSNVYIINCFKNYKNNNPTKINITKKQFRKELEYQNAISNLKVYLRQILKNSEKIDDEFSVFDLKTFEIDLEVFDFNHKYYLEVFGIKKNLIIVTTDSDFFNYSRDGTVIKVG